MIQLTQFKKNINSNKSLLKQVKDNYLKSLALYETEEEISKEIHEEILKENVFNSKYKTERRITKKEQDFNMSEEDFKKYLKLVHKRFIEKGFKNHKENLVFSYKSFELLQETKKQLINAFLEVIPKEIKKDLINGMNKRIKNIQNRTKIHKIIFKFKSLIFIFFY